MTLIVVTSANPGDGKTGIAAAIARRIAYGGTPVRLVRARPSTDASNAAADAAWFAGLDFAPGSTSGTPDLASVTASADEVVVAEADADAGIPEGAIVVAVGRGQVAELPEGVTASLHLVTAFDPTSAPLPDSVDDVPVVVLNEDRVLAGFSVSELRDLLGAEVISEGDLGDPTCDHLVVAPIGSDAGLPYFDRFRSKAVLARFDRTDMHLAAIRSEPSCLVLTGGSYPSDYVLDAVRATGVPLLLSYADTESSVIALEELWDRTRFHGERKLDHIDGALEEAGLWDRLPELLQGS